MLSDKKEDVQKITVQGSDQVLINKINRELSLYKKALKTSEKVEILITINSDGAPLLYDEFGQPRRWHKKLIAKLAINTLDGKTVHQTTIISRQSFNHISESQRLLSQNLIDDQIVQDLVDQIVSEVERQL